MDQKTFIFVFLVHVIVAASKGSLDKKKSKCEPLITPLCSFMAKKGYNMTTFPNLHSHRKQEEAITEMTQLVPLISSKCSPMLPYFLCATYFPLCIEGSVELFKPCKSLCIESRKGCEKLMNRFGFSWPFNCSKYPDDSDGMCFRAPVAATSTTVAPKVVVSKKKRKNRGKVSGMENETLNMKCGKDKVIEIRKVSHKLSMCCAQATKAVLSAICRNTSHCAFTVSQETFGAHCQSTVGSVLVKYKCIPESRQAKTCA